VGETVIPSETRGRESRRGIPSPYRETLAWLFGTQRFGIKLGLENSRRLFTALGVPSPSEKIIHVAGTNGKGSVCALLDSICRAAGYRTALFTSPHLVSFRERIQVDGALISEEEVALGLTKIRELVADWDPHPTFFEITTALALDYFREREVEIVVLETGMGGRLDATNATQPVVSVLTPIDYDHQKWLGDTLAEIAFEKAGIIKSNVPVVSALQPAEAEAVVRTRVAACGAPLDFVRQPFDRFPVALSGTHQKQNAALAISALHTAQITIDETALERGLASVVWPARFQRWDARTIIDGAHNPAGARILMETWRETFGDRRATILLAVLQDKDVAGICAALQPIAQRVLLPLIRSERALAPEQLRLTICDQLPGVSVAVSPSFAVAWEEAQGDAAPILICGSLHFAGEALVFLRGGPAAFEECRQ
jgi:dihydrofolate synthase / folylpolyglutamate synthase